MPAPVPAMRFSALAFDQSLPDAGCNFGRRRSDQICASRAAKRRGYPNTRDSFWRRGEDSDCKQPARYSLGLRSSVRFSNSSRRERRLPLGFSGVPAASGYDCFYVVDAYTASLPYREREKRHAL